MADKPVTIRMGNDTEKILNSLIEESGLPKKEFLERLVKDQEIRQKREGLPNRKTAENILALLKRAGESMIEVLKVDNDKILLKEEEIEKLKEESRVIRSAAADEIALAKEQVRESKETVARIQDETNKEIESYKERTKKAEQVVDEVKAGGQRMEKEIEDLRAQVKDLRNDRERARKEAETFKTENSSLRKESSKAISQVSELQKKLTENEKRVVIAREEGMREAQKEAKGIIEKLQSHVEHLQKDSQKQVERLQNDLASIHKEKEGLWKQLLKSHEEGTKLEKLKTSSSEKTKKE